MDRRKISDRWELKRIGLNRRMLLPYATIIIAFSTMKIFSDEDCSDSDTDNIPTLLHYATVENSSSVSEENQQSQQQMDRREVNRTNNTVCSGILTPQSSDSGPVLVVEPQTAQASDSALIPVLKDMFPTKSDADINEVITSVQGNLDAAIESLLDQNNIVLDEHGASNFNEELSSLRSVHSPGIALQQYRNQMIDGGLRHYININRNSQTLFRDIVGIYKRARDDLRNKPDVTFVGEEGVDAGGPTLESLWLALSQMRQGDGGKVSLFEGSSGHLLPVHCTSYLDSGLFYIFGKVVAHSILHGGTGFPGLSPAMPWEGLLPVVMSILLHLWSLQKTFQTQITRMSLKRYWGPKLLMTYNN
ncbi:uncharacterized protein LOC141889264 isoform X2 [Acropora palmata]|uniref:uncharacterized protein LOC141889264 isoform X2 n=1 Tax=Acropora palmata TaxID=6131 RepID=UPI003DA0B8FE